MAIETSPEDWLSRKDAADYIIKKGYSISAQTMANMASNNNAGKGPPYQRLGWNAVRYQRKDLDAWVAARTVRVA